MEVSSTTIVPKNGSGGSGEVRRLHIIYFLSRTGGCVEHPHLVRVHHLCRKGVFLRDVKRWLAALRGRDMPESFVWSYKRRYKNGYVWQDLTDGDLITPISDNEFVLKGSEIPPVSPPPDEKGIQIEKKALKSTKSRREIYDDYEFQTEDKELKGQGESYKQENESKQPPESKVTDTPTVELPQSYQESSISYSDNSHTDDSHDHDDQYHANSSPTSRHGNVNNINKPSSKKNKDSYDSEFYKRGMSSNSSFTSASAHNKNQQFTRSKSTSTSCGTPKLLRNLITCGGDDTNDSVLVASHNKSKLDIKHRDSYKTCGEKTIDKSVQDLKSTWKLQKLHREARKSFQGVATSNSQHWSPKKTLRSPTCSQCGKHFRPEKLHAHMKSCRGLMKALTQANTSSISMRSSEYVL